MSDTVLLTGATGFVGRQVFQSLAATGTAVRLVLREGRQAEYAAHPAVEGILATTDLFAESEQWWAAACREIDTVIHVAWYAEPGRYLQSIRNLDCLQGTLELAKGASHAGIRRFVGIGTCFEYDLSGGRLSIETPLKPLSPYAAAKSAAFLTLSQWFAQQSIAFAWCRLFYLYGEGEDERRLVPYLKRQFAAGEVAKLTRGTQIRDFLDVEEAGRLIVQAALSTVQGPLNICSGNAVTVRELAEKIADEYGGHHLLQFGARPDNLVDPPQVVGIKSNVMSNHKDFA